MRQFMSEFWLKLNRERMTKKYRKLTNKQKNKTKQINTRIDQGLSLIFNFKYFEEADGSLTFFFLQTYLIIDFFCTYYRLSLLSRIIYHNKRGCNEPQVVLYLAKTPLWLTDFFALKKAPVLCLSIQLVWRSVLNSFCSELNTISQKPHAMLSSSLEEIGKGRYTLGDKLQQHVAATHHSICTGRATSCSNKVRRQ